MKLTIEKKIKNVFKKDRQAILRKKETNKETKKEIWT